MDKSIEQRAEEKIEEIFKKHYMSYGEYDVELIKPELIEYFKACQQNLEVSERFAKLTDEERMEILSDYCTYCGQNEKELGKCYCAPHYDD